IIFRLVPNFTPLGKPYEATFCIPQSVTKADMQTTYIRMDNYITPLCRGWNGTWGDDDKSFCIRSPFYFFATVYCFISSCLPVVSPSPAAQSDTTAPPHFLLPSPLLPRHRSCPPSPDSQPLPNRASPCRLSCVASGPAPEPCRCQVHHMPPTTQENQASYWRRSYSSLRS
ncbi:hypothetical protein BC826DRAFT_921787, partial [Russula brevipes]